VALVGVDYGELGESDVLVLTLDVSDTESHAAATDTVIRHFGQVLTCPCLHVTSAPRLIISLNTKSFPTFNAVILVCHNR